MSTESDRYGDDGIEERKKVGVRGYVGILQTFLRIYEEAVNLLYEVPDFKIIISRFSVGGKRISSRVGSQL